MKRAFIRCTAESDACMRQCCGPQRGFTMHIIDNFGQVNIIAIFISFRLHLDLYACHDVLYACSVRCWNRRICVELFIVVAC